MDLVEDLAYGIVQDYREEQKSRLQRTFVSGSSAPPDSLEQCRRPGPQPDPWSPLDT